MNNLSWMIYFADVAGGAQGLFSLAAFASLVMAVVTTVTWAGTNDGPTLYSHYTAEQRQTKTAAHEAFRAKVARLIRPSIFAGVLSAVIVTVLPSSSTIYAIAASEMGETALKSETGNKAVKALNAWLDRQIADEPETAK